MKSLLHEILDMAAEAAHNPRVVSYITRGNLVIAGPRVAVEYEQSRYRKIERCYLTYSLFRDAFRDVVC